MNIGVIVGRVLKAQAAQTKAGKPVGNVRVEVEKAYGEKTFKTRFEVAVYGQDADAASKLQPGTLVSAQGEIGATTREWQGKTYANLTLTGRVTVLQDRPEWPEGKEAAPAPRQAPPAAQPAPAGAPTPEDDDVPF